MKSFKTFSLGIILLCNVTQLLSMDPEQGSQSQKNQDQGALLPKDENDHIEIDVLSTIIKRNKEQRQKMASDLVECERITREMAQRHKAMIEQEKNIRTQLVNLYLLAEVVAHLGRPNTNESNPTNNTNND